MINHTLAVFQLISGVLGVSAAESIFTNRLLATLALDTPTVTRDRILNTGASNLRMAFGPEQLPGVLVAYEAGLKDVWIAAIALCGLAFCVSLFVPVQSIKEKEKSEEGV